MQSRKQKMTYWTVSVCGIPAESGENRNHDQCPNTIKEFGSYIWDQKASERGEDKPVKQHDHAMDALRYFCYTIIRKPGSIGILK